MRRYALKVGLSALLATSQLAVAPQPASAATELTGIRIEADVVEDGAGRHWHSWQPGMLDSDFPCGTCESGLARALHAEGEGWAEASTTGRLRAWDGQHTALLDVGVSGHVHDLEYSPSGNSLVALLRSDQGSIALEVLDLQSGQSTHRVVLNELDVDLDAGLAVLNDEHAVVVADGRLLHVKEWVAPLQAPSPDDPRGPVTELDGRGNRFVYLQGDTLVLTEGEDQPEWDLRRKVRGEIELLSDGLTVLNAAPEDGAVRLRLLHEDGTDRSAFGSPSSPAPTVLGRVTAVHALASSGPGPVQPLPDRPDPTSWWLQYDGQIGDELVLQPPPRGEKAVAIEFFWRWGSAESSSGAVTHKGISLGRHPLNGSVIRLRLFSSMLGHRGVLTGYSVSAQGLLAREAESFPLQTLYPPRLILGSGGTYDYGTPVGLGGVLAERDADFALPARPLEVWARMPLKDGGYDSWRKIRDVLPGKAVAPLRLVQTIELQLRFQGDKPDYLTSLPSNASPLMMLGPANSPVRRLQVRPRLTLSAPVQVPNGQVIGLTGRVSHVRPIVVHEIGAGQRSFRITPRPDGTWTLRVRPPRPDQGYNYYVTMAADRTQAGAALPEGAAVPHRHVRYGRVP